MHACKFKKGTIRAMLYVAIAALAALMADLAGLQSFSELNAVGAVIIAINFTLQGLIAWRAFLDQTLSRDEIKNKPNVGALPLPAKTPAMELLLENDK